jgi:hypothetical protein
MIVFRVNVFTKSNRLVTFTKIEDMLDESVSTIGFLFNFTKKTEMDRNNWFISEAIN